MELESLNRYDLLVGFHFLNQCQITSYIKRIHIFLYAGKRSSNTKTFIEAKLSGAINKTKIYNGHYYEYFFLS